ncbi:hypothetical protein QYE76_064503 [Lolium multiflorum]|uniref:Uncharacterized protein n=1 Tax=Lolium multiflorum TaxID=4521 RepID=A0AAD8W801_LOLMU|nr:hypothetical protein QYE76_064503 [Lolium multiflorum]
MRLVRTGIGDGGGDFESHPGGCVVPATPRPGKDGEERRSSAGPAGASWGRFWAGAGEDAGEESSEEGRSDLECSPAEQEDVGTEGASRPSGAMSLGGFIARAEELGGSLRHRRRTAFAPGGRSSRFWACSAPRFNCLGDGGGHRGGRERGGGRRRVSGAGLPWDGPAGDSRRPPPPVSPRRVVGSVSSREEGTSPTQAEPGPLWPCVGPGMGPAEDGTGHPLLLLGPPLSGLSEPLGDLAVRPMRQEEAQYAGPRWLWLAKGYTTPSLGFPARLGEVSRFRSIARTLFRIPAPPPLSKSFAAVVMERYGGEGSGGDGRNKRRFGAYGDGEGRRQGAGRQEGGRLDLGRHDGGRSESGRRDGDHQEGGRDLGRHEGGRRGRNDEEPRPRYGEHRSSDSERGDWGPPPPWWEWEQQRLREVEAARAGGKGSCRSPQAAAAAAAEAGRPAGTKKGEGKGRLPTRRHASANCPTRGCPMMLQQMGHAITGGGFYNIEVEPLEGSGQVETFEAVIHFDVAPLSALQLADELKNLLDGAWDWSVAKVSEKEFSFTGLPGDLMERERLMAALTMIGRPLDVDELSVKKCKTEPVRVRFQCRFPERIKGTIALCVNGEPYTVGVQAELGTTGAGGSNPPRPPPPGDDDDDADDLESEDRSTDGERWNRHRKNDKSKAAAPPAGPGSGAGGGGAQRALTGGAGGGSSLQRALTGGAHSAPPAGAFRGRTGPTWTSSRRWPWGRWLSTLGLRRRQTWRCSGARGHCRWCGGVAGGIGRDVLTRD